MSAPRLLPRLRRLVDSVVGAILGGAVYGAWVLYVNWDAGVRIAGTAAAAHWAMSTLLTYCGTGLMRRCYRLGSRPLEAILFACGGGLTLTYALLISVHLAIGTPHLALTLAAGVVPNLVFCISYVSLLLRTEPLRAAQSINREDPLEALSNESAS